jgi:glycosyltransferase involved in cell wall biosynthesis
MQRIMIDARNLSLDKGTGVATYAKNLSYCLHQLKYKVEVLYGSRAAPGQTDLMKEIAFFDNNAGDIPKWLKALRTIKESALSPLGYEATEVPITGSVITETFKSRLPYFDSIYNSPDLFRKSSYGSNKLFYYLREVHIKNKPDLMHWTYPLKLKIPKIPNIYTLHDLVPLRLPYTTLDNKRRYLKLLTEIVKKADHIVTVSEASKLDIINLFGISESKITNTYQAVSIPQKYLQKPFDFVCDEIEGTFGLKPKNYFLFFGSIEPKKNIGRMIEAFLSCRTETQLVIVGAQAWKSEEELRLLNDDVITSKILINGKYKVHRRIVHLEYASFPLLISLIKAAKAVLFPSLYEGFGLPVLESMLLGTPVLTSNVSSIPEVAGDAALLVNPYDVTEIAAGIRMLDNDSDLRNKLTLDGIKQASLFSEDNYCDRLSNMYKKLL